MSPDRDAAKKPPDSSPDDEVYAENEDGDARMVSSFRRRDHLYQGADSSQIVDPKVYGLLLLVGVGLLFPQQYFTSMIGFCLLGIGVFIGAVDVVSRS